MTVTKSAHTRHAMSSSLIPLMVRICGPQLDSHLHSFQKREGHLAGPRRREQGNPMNEEGAIARGWVLPRGASHVEGWATIKEVAKVRLEGILYCLQLLVVV